MKRPFCHSLAKRPEELRMDSVKWEPGDLELYLNLSKLKLGREDFLECPCSECSRLK